MIRTTAMALFLAATFNVHAADKAPAAKADPAKAKPIAESVCVGCHGADGNSPAAPNPIIAGQGAAYIAKQLSNFKPVGDKPALRDNAIMAGMSAGLSEDDIKNLAAYFSQQKIKPAVAKDEKLIAEGVPVMQPAGGHAVYIDAKAFLPHIPSDQYPGQALVGALYLEGGIRGVEIGSLMFGKYDEQGKLVPATLELVRLAIPRRVYTQSHIDYVAEVIIDVFNKRNELKGMIITEETPILRHFTAKLKPVNE